MVLELHLHELTNFQCRSCDPCFSRCLAWMAMDPSPWSDLLRFSRAFIVVPTPEHVELLALGLQNHLLAQNTCGHNGVQCLYIPNPISFDSACFPVVVLEDGCQYDLSDLPQRPSALQKILFDVGGVLIFNWYATLGSGLGEWSFGCEEYCLVTEMPSASVSSTDTGRITFLDLCRTPRRGPHLPSSRKHKRLRNVAALLGHRMAAAPHDARHYISAHSRGSDSLVFLTLSVLHVEGARV